MSDLNSTIEDILAEFCEAGQPDKTLGEILNINPESLKNISLEDLDLTQCTFRAVHRAVFPPMLGGAVDGDTLDKVLNFRLNRIRLGKEGRQELMTKLMELTDHRA